MKKVLSKIIFLLVTIPLALLFACTPTKDVTSTDGNNKPSREDAEISLCYSVLDEDRAFSLDEDVVIGLYYGTNILYEEIINSTQSEAHVIYGSEYLLDNSIYAFQMEKTATSTDMTLAIQNIKTEQMVKILDINDFCVENYPMVDINNLKEPHMVVLPKELFKGQEGVIVIWLSVNKLKSVTVKNSLYYTIENNKIILDEKKISYTGHSITGEI